MSALVQQQAIKENTDGILRYAFKLKLFRVR